ncbi:MAG: hypothetical protein V7754_21395 [Halioglobus sp.]
MVDVYFQAKRDGTAAKRFFSKSSWHTLTIIQTSNPPKVR